MNELDLIIQRLVTISQIQEYARSHGVEIPMRTIQEACKSSTSLYAKKIGHGRHGVFVTTKKNMIGWVEQYRRKKIG